MLSTGIVSLNWLVYIWAVFTERVLETSLGYFINPLVSVLLGVIFLGERLRPWQVVAVALAGVGVLNLAFGAADFPWIALTLAFSFGTYGLIRKTVAVGSVDGLLVETTLLLPFAIAFLAYLAITGGGNFATGGLQISVLLVLAGPATALPLIWFTSAARRLRLSTVGFFQYIAPSCQFLLAVVLFGEPFTTTHLITFACIWLALALFTADSLLAARRLRAAR
jgi:chloramphenicol-sensitive protein RarD